MPPRARLTERRVCLAAGDEAAPDWTRVTLEGFINIGLLADWLGAPEATVVTGIEGLSAMAPAFPLWRRI